MPITNQRLGEILTEMGVITITKFKELEITAKKNNEEIYDTLLNSEVMHEAELGSLMADELGFPFISLQQEKIIPATLNLLPEAVARAMGVVIFARETTGIKAAMLRPDDTEITSNLKKLFGQKVTPYFVTKNDWLEAMSLYQESLAEKLNTLTKKTTGAPIAREEKEGVTIKIVDEIFQNGQRNKASDIHIEPYEKKLMVRFRIDGIMHDILELPKEYADPMITRIKILSKMRTDEHRAAQDGKLRFLFKQSGQEVDVRVSIVPVTHGENMVMRLLSSDHRQYSLTDLGLSNNDLQKVQRGVDRPHGMVLVTGPTGSGKTTSVYAMMKILNTRDVHISTIEDPVEYAIDGVSQIQVNTRTDLTFAKGLRAIVRQDPDIIMVGEIRDTETADIAVNSALTGHLVLSTLHTNDAATTLPRLLDMGVEAFLVASTVNVAIAQRLVRKICLKCRVSTKLNNKELSSLDKFFAKLDPTRGQKIKASLTKRAYKGTGCLVCNSTGYGGRIGIFEVLEINDTIQDLIMKQSSSDEIMKAAKNNGMTTMLEDGLDKVINGLTTLEEVWRTTKD